MKCDSDDIKSDGKYCMLEHVDKIDDVKRCTYLKVVETTLVDPSFASGLKTDGGVYNCECSLAPSSSLCLRL